ncbi:MAG: hypothetical protein P1U53_15520 [Sulfitobacter sp.]|nr:hypothetical protein [Sulfitobacter sp.]
MANLKSFMLSPMGMGIATLVAVVIIVIIVMAVRGKKDRFIPGMRPGLSNMTTGSNLPIWENGNQSAGRGGTMETEGNVNLPAPGLGPSVPIAHTTMDNEGHYLNQGMRVPIPYVMAAQGMSNTMGHMNNLTGMRESMCSGESASCCNTDQPHMQLGSACSPANPNATEELNALQQLGN